MRIYKIFRAKEWEAAKRGGIYLGSLALFAYGVRDQHAPQSRSGGRLRLYVRLFTQRGILLFVPTWVAINAIVGVWVPQGLYLLTGSSGVAANGQFLLSGFSPTLITSALAGLALIGGFGLFFWGNSFDRHRRTSVLLGGVVAFVVLRGARPTGPSGDRGRRALRQRTRHRIGVDRDLARDAVVGVIYESVVDND